MITAKDYPIGTVLDNFGEVWTITKHHGKREVILSRDSFDAFGKNSPETRITHVSHLSHYRKL